MSNEMWLGFVGAVVVSSVINGIASKIITRKPETCIMHDELTKASKREQHDILKEINTLNDCYHKLDKKIDVFIETSKVKQDVVVELSHAIKTMVEYMKDQRP